jgi:hypothetical protein
MIGMEENVANRLVRAFAARMSRRSMAKGIGATIAASGLPSIDLNSAVDAAPAGTTVTSRAYPSGSFLSAWQRTGGPFGYLGAPLSGTVEVAGGEAE